MQQRPSSPAPATQERTMAGMSQWIRAEVRSDDYGTVEKRFRRMFLGSLLLCGLIALHLMRLQTAFGSLPSLVRLSFFPMMLWGLVVAGYAFHALSLAAEWRRRKTEEEGQKYERRLQAEVRERTEEIGKSREEMILLLMAAQEHRHDETGAHIQRLGLYAEAFATRLGRPGDYAGMLRLAAPLHDIGKIGVPDSILLKPGKLTDTEYQRMEEHAAIGEHILREAMTPAAVMARNIALCHHEWWDGTGYPNRLSGETIPEPARIVAVLDVYDALVHDRVYRPAILEEEALEMMKCERGSHFDPQLLDCFLQMVPELRRIREHLSDRASPTAHEDRRAERHPLRSTRAS